jgi:carbon storage regulator
MRVDRLYVGLDGRERLLGRSAPLVAMVIPSGPRPSDETTGGAAVLVLTRKTSQSIMIGDEVEVSVLSISGDKVRIGVDAPRSIPVFRKEIYLDIHRGSPEDTDPKEVEEALDRLKSS